MQKNQTITFLRNQTKLIYEKEFMAILYAVGQWQYYLEGTSFVIRTDQCSLKYSLDQSMSSMVQ